jgi:hypothetical protein
MRKNNIYIHGSCETNLFYCDSDKSLENCTVSTVSGETITPALLKKETLETSSRLKRSNFIFIGVLKFGYLRSARRIKSCTVAVGFLS